MICDVVVRYNPYNPEWVNESKWLTVNIIAVTKMH
jgi:hypothetical protein